MPARRACSAILALPVSSSSGVIPPFSRYAPSGCWHGNAFGHSPPDVGPAPGRLAGSSTPAGGRRWHGSCSLTMHVDTDDPAPRSGITIARRECGHGCARQRSPSNQGETEMGAARERSPTLPQGHSGRGIGRGLAGRPCRKPRIDGPGAGAGVSGRRLAQALPHPRLGPDGALGLFQQVAAAGGRGRVGRFRDHRDAHPPRQRRRLAHDPRRSGR